jgi:hypothetical protein
VSRKAKQRRDRVVALVRAAGAERSEAEDARTSGAVDAVRGRPGRRSTSARPSICVSSTTCKRLTDHGGAVIHRLARPSRFPCMVHRDGPPN